MTSLPSQPSGVQAYSHWGARAPVASEELLGSAAEYMGQTDFPGLAVVADVDQRILRRGFQRDDASLQDEPVDGFLVQVVFQQRGSRYVGAGVVFQMDGQPVALAVHLADDGSYCHCRCLLLSVKFGAGDVPSFAVAPAGHDPVAVFRNQIVWESVTRVSRFVTSSGVSRKRLKWGGRLSQSASCQSSGAAPDKASASGAGW